MAMMAVITTVAIIAVAISYRRRNKKGDKTGTQIHHTSPIYDTIPDNNIIAEQGGNVSSSQGALPRQATILERRDQNNMMQRPNRHPAGSTRLEGHNNNMIMVWDGNQQRGRESIQVRENEAYMYYAVADQYVHVPVQETNPEDNYVNVRPNNKDAENYIYPTTNKWVNSKQNV